MDKVWGKKVLSFHVWCRSRKAVNSYLRGRSWGAFIHQLGRSNPIYGWVLSLTIAFHTIVNLRHCAGTNFFKWSEVLRTRRRHCSQFYLFDSCRLCFVSPCNESVGGSKFQFCEEKWTIFLYVRAYQGVKVDGCTKWMIPFLYGFSLAFLIISNWRF